jgi:hypothetical protein
MSFDNASMMAQSDKLICYSSVFLHQKALRTEY